ncbi:hypothetical protein Scep_027146 [Stephania cephalantha]|uniref:Uncharacterized protein n=1 Tax=Stephania cephalantha TaxID=152367 RepID=A0AAP0EPN7_9MAGN
MALSSLNALFPDRLFFFNIRNPNPNSPFLVSSNQRNFSSSTPSAQISPLQCVANDRNSTLLPRVAAAERSVLYHRLMVQVVSSAILFVGVSLRAGSAVAGKLPGGLAPAVRIVEERIGRSAVNVEDTFNGDGTFDVLENVEDEDMRAALESWKSKVYALTVPLRVVALRGSIPPSWIKDFVLSQGRRLKLNCEFRGSLSDIFSELLSCSSKGIIAPRSAMAADIITIGDSWLGLGIQTGIVEPIEDVEGQDWFKGLSEQWKVYLRRNDLGNLDSNGKIWAAPYRWGSMVIAYKTNKFQKHNLAPIEDWADLWRPELAGKISMVDSPREVVGAVLKYMGASYNTKNIDTEVACGKKGVMQNLGILQKQVRLFDSNNYLKAFTVGDVWVAVGWSSDIVPAAKRMSNVSVVVPKSGASLWADLWVYPKSYSPFHATDILDWEFRAVASGETFSYNLLLFYTCREGEGIANCYLEENAIPSASKFATSSIGGRIRGPSPLIHQWIEFCTQAARALPFKQEVIPGATALSLDTNSFDRGQELMKGKPKLDTNLIAGVPPPEILAKCEFMEPLSDAALEDYKWLIASMEKPRNSMIDNVQRCISSIVQKFGAQPQSR